MTTDQSRVLGELALPLAPEAGLLDALALAVAIEEGCGVTLPDDLITVTHLGTREAIQATLSALPKRA